MIEEIGGLELEMLAVALDRGKRRLDRFLANLLGAFLDALGQQLGRIGDLGRRARAGASPYRRVRPEPRACGVRDRSCPAPDASYHSSQPHGNSPFRHVRLGLGRCVNVPKWKIEAARTAEAWPSADAPTRWSSVPTPPEAMTGTAHRIGNGAHQRDVEALAGAVAVHRGDQHLAGARGRDLARQSRRHRCRSDCARHG